MLIESMRPSKPDIEEWKRKSKWFRAHGSSREHERHVENAERALVRFGSTKTYCGVSWGKDSVVVADIVTRLAPEIPLVWVRVSPIENPDCFLVRDAFLSLHDRVNYHEIVVQYDSGSDEGTGRLSSGFRQAASRFGTRYISGVRGDESASRSRRVAHWGENTNNTCAPLARWSAVDVFAYSLTRGLPIAPAYACLMNGLLDPCKIRIATLGGERGTGHGRASWEWRYYPQEMEKLFPNDRRQR